jgi:hypothetical protein
MRDKYNFILASFQRRQSSRQVVLAIRLVFILCLFSSSVCFASVASANNQRIAEKACKWLRSQQTPETGLVRSYNSPSDNIAMTYDQALAINALLAVNEINFARQCADAMLEIRDTKFNAWTDGYNVCTARPEAKSIAVGPNAWMGIALLHLYQFTKEQKYLSAAEAVGKFILSLQSSKGTTAGSIAGGYDEDGRPFGWTSTEHNADCVAFFTALADATGKECYQDAAGGIVKWLDREMWDKKESCYYTGYEDNNSINPQVSSFPERLDSQTWTILALISAAGRQQKPEKISDLLHNGLPWIDRHINQVSYSNDVLTGFAKITIGARATPSFWSEGTVGYLLAAKRIGHTNPELEKILQSLQKLQREDGSVPYSVGVSCVDVIEQFHPFDSVIADFESHPNRLYGEIGVYGDGEPDWAVIKKTGFSEPYSWYYEPNKPGYNKANVHSGLQSFRLVNAGPMCKYKRQDWASLGLDLGIVTGYKKIKPVDVSSYKELSFWAKTTNPDGASMKVTFLDTHKRSYIPEAAPKPSRLTKEWQRFIVELNSVEPIIDLHHLTNIGLSFGRNQGNSAGTIIYVDDIAFSGSATKTDISNGTEMPPMFPQNWSFGSVAGTTWLLFAELDINPFGSYKTTPSRLVDNSNDFLKNNKKYCQLVSPIDVAFDKLFTFSANLDASYRKTQLYKSNDNARVFQGDTRLDLWLPPFRDEFSWGPFVRFGGVASNRNYEWENNWGAKPGAGLQIYPFSSRSMKEDSDLYHNLSKIFGPLHLFAEYDAIDYSGRENSWRPDELVRIGADYWNEWYVNDTRYPWWAENWNGLIWHSTNGFDKDYKTLIFANSLRFGIREPDAGLASMFTPYLAAESSLSENGDYAWENKLLIGGGIRFAPPIKFLSPQLNITRFVVYAEYVVPAAYYRSSPPSSTPDHDFRAGINIYIGEWWHK